MIKNPEPGVYFCLAGGDGDAPAIRLFRATLPLLGKFGAIVNVIFLATRETPIGTYLLGVPVDTMVDTLLNWTPPPQASQPIEEDKFLWSAKMPQVPLECEGPRGAGGGREHGDAPAAGRHGRKVPLAMPDVQERRHPEYRAVARPCEHRVRRDKLEHLFMQYNL